MDNQTLPNTTLTPTTPNSVLRAENVSKAFHISKDPNEVLKNVSLEVSKGEFVAIMGPSGCGKSTLLHVLSGLEPPDSGVVEIEGQDLWKLNEEKRSVFRREHLGFVFQFFNLMPTLTAAENISLPLTLRQSKSLFSSKKKKETRNVQERIEALMNALELHGLQGHGPEEISGGEQQRVAIARALVLEPDVVFADEPTGNLDWNTGHSVMQLLTKLCRENQQTLILVTHDARVAAYANRVLIMRDGQVRSEIKLPQSQNLDPNSLQPNVKLLVSRLEEFQL